MNRFKNKKTQSKEEVNEEYAEKIFDLIKKDYNTLKDFLINPLNVVSLEYNFLLNNKYALLEIILNKDWGCGKMALLQSE